MFACWVRSDRSAQVKTVLCPCVVLIGPPLRREIQQNGFKFVSAPSPGHLEGADVVTHFGLQVCGPFRHSAGTARNAPGRSRAWARNANEHWPIVFGAPVIGGRATPTTKPIRKGCGIPTPPIVSHELWIGGARMNPQNDNPHPKARLSNLD